MKKYKADIVVVLVNYHNSGDTVTCIESILSNSNCSLKIVVVDNSVPKDLSLESLVLINDEIEVIFNNENVGFGKANNIGIEWAKNHIYFNYLFLLNNDTIIQSDTLDVLTETLIANPSAGIATCRINFYDHPDLIWYDGASINYQKGWPQITNYKKNVNDIVPRGACEVEFVSGCAMMFTRESIESIGGFYPYFFMYCEDLELSIRAAELGWKLIYSDKTTILHKVQGSIKEENSKSRNTIGMHPRNPNIHFLFYHMKSNQYHTMRLHMSRLEFRKFRVYFWGRFIVFNLIMILHGRIKILQTSIRTIRNIRSLAKNSEKLQEK